MVRARPPAARASHERRDAASGQDAAVDRSQWHNWHSFTTARLPVLYRTHGMIEAKAMVPRPETSATGLSRVLQALVSEFRRTSGADLVSLYLYDAAAERYYAPFAIGQPEESLLDSLTDMQTQLAGYIADAAQDKVPDDLGVQQYGSTVWLTASRRTLVARNALAEI